MATTRTTFRSEAVRAALLEKIIRILGGSTVGGVEQLAGVPQDHQSRFEFYCAADRRAAEIHGSAFRAGHTIDEAMAECRRRIAERTAWVSL